MPSPLALETTNLLIISVGWPTLDLTTKWDDTKFPYWFLKSFIFHNCFSISSVWFCKSITYSFFLYIFVYFFLRQSILIIFFPFLQILPAPPPPSYPSNILFLSLSPFILPSLSSLSSDNLLYKFKFSHRFLCLFVTIQRTIVLVHICWSLVSLFCFRL